MERRSNGQVTELADRLLARQRRGEELGSEFEIEYGALTDDERDAYDALVEQRLAHGQERLEAIEATNAALKELLRLQVRKAPGMTVREAIAAVTSASCRSSRRSTACPTRHDNRQRRLVERPRRSDRANRRFMAAPSTCGLRPHSDRDGGGRAGFAKLGLTRRLAQLESANTYPARLRVGIVIAVVTLVGCGGNVGSTRSVKG